MVKISALFTKHIKQDSVLWTLLNTFLFWISTCYLKIKLEHDYSWGKRLERSCNVSLKYFTGYKKRNVRLLWTNIFSISKIYLKENFLYGFALNYVSNVWEMTDNGSSIRNAPAFYVNNLENNKCMVFKVTLDKLYEFLLFLQSKHPVCKAL